MLCFVDRASRYFRAKKNQIDAQFIFSIFRQTSTSCPGWIGIQPGQQTVI